MFTADGEGTESPTALLWALLFAARVSISWLTSPIIEGDCFSCACLRVIAHIYLSRRARVTAAAPVFFAAASIRSHMEKTRHICFACVCLGFMLFAASTAGYLSFGLVAQCVVHALKGLACRASPSRAR